MEDSAHMPILIDNDSVSKSLLIERIETKIEEYMESGYHWEDGILDGLKIALDIINQ